MIDCSKALERCNILLLSGCRSQQQRLEQRAPLKVNRCMCIKRFSYSCDRLTLDEKNRRTGTTRAKSEVLSSSPVCSSLCGVLPAVAFKLSITRTREEDGFTKNPQIPYIHDILRTPVYAHKREARGGARVRPDRARPRQHASRIYIIRRHRICIAIIIQLSGLKFKGALRHTTKRV